MFVYDRLICAHKEMNTGNINADEQCVLLELWHSRNITHFKLKYEDNINVYTMMSMSHVFGGDVKVFN